MRTGDWTQEREREFLAFDDDSFLNAMESRHLRGEQEVTGKILGRLIKMADARPVLKHVEWAGPDGTCPFCGGHRPGEPRPVAVEKSGHGADCELDNVLTA